MTHRFVEGIAELQLERPSRLTTAQDPVTLNLVREVFAYRSYGLDWLFSRPNFKV